MKFFKSYICVLVLLILVPVEMANAGIRRTAEEARQIELQLGSCSGTEQEVIDCVQVALEDFGAGLSKGFRQKAPKVGPIIRDAAEKIKKARSKSAALSVLNKVRATIRGLAAKRSGEAKEIYKRVALTLSRALKVIKRKI